VTFCSGAGSALLRDTSTFKVAIIDEATQATEASTLLPLLKGAECVVLAGDPKQLPPTVLSEKAKELGLETCATSCPSPSPATKQCSAACMHM
jgi:superfamily I DNA and/or RNA helicase